MAIRRIGVCTGGGDAPGLNAVIRAVVLSAEKRGWEVLGIPKGIEGLLRMKSVRPLTHADVRGITHQGGTILGTSNKGDAFVTRRRGPGGQESVVDRTDVAVQNASTLGLDAIISIGGDGSMRIAYELVKRGVPIVGVPKTIDNDLEGTVITFGFDTAVSVATEALGRLHSTTEAHERIMVVEVMGRYAGWIALNAGVASQSDAILLPEIPFEIEVLAEKVRERVRTGRNYSLVVVAEGARPLGGEMVFQGDADGEGAPRLGGIADRVARMLQVHTGKEARSMVLGHLQRGGLPSAWDRLIALRFGAAAVRTVEREEFGVMVALDPPEVKTIPLTDAIARMKTVPLDCDTITTARDLGICFGDRLD